MIPLSDLFDVIYGHSLELNRLVYSPLSEGGVPFVSRKMGDNGISSFVKPITGLESAPAGELTCALSGNGVLSTFLQETSFYTGFHVARLKPRRALSKAHLLFYCACITANRYRFSYGRQANRTIKTILVPDLHDVPAYVTQADVGRFDGGDKPALPRSLDRLIADNWQSFSLGSLFEVLKGQRLTKSNMLPGQFPYIGASDASNGLTARIGQAPIHKGGTISVSYNGSVAEAFYQAEDYWATDDVNVLYPRGFVLSPAAALFVCTLIRLEKYRFNYGRKWHLDRMREAHIKLPVNHEGKPDWAFMESYVNALPYSSQIHV